jgi:N6-adenosine-specific RNA methylase IME4
VAWVAKAVKPSRRREGLTFQHHREVAALRPSEADRLLDVAQAQGFSTRQLRLAVRRAQDRGPTEFGETCTVRDLDKLAESGQRFRTIYADPPWPYENETTGLATANHYWTMTIQELGALPVHRLAASDGYLHLWVTSAFLVGPPELIFKAWGFAYSGSSFVLIKRRIGLGNYWRISHEFLLTGIRGKVPRFSDHSLRSWLEVERTGRSVKPEQVRALVERATPGPYLELFGRRKVTGWTVWGDQIRRTTGS